MKPRNIVTAMALTVFVCFAYVPIRYSYIDSGYTAKSHYIYYAYRSETIVSRLMANLISELNLIGTEDAYKISNPTGKLLQDGVNADTLYNLIEEEFHIVPDFDISTLRAVLDIRETEEAYIIEILNDNGLVMYSREICSR